MFFLAFIIWVTTFRTSLLIPPAPADWCRWTAPVHYFLGQQPFVSCLEKRKILLSGDTLPVLSYTAPRLVSLGFFFFFPTCVFSVHWMCILVSSTCSCGGDAAVRAGLFMYDGGTGSCPVSFRAGLGLAQGIQRLLTLATCSMFAVPSSQVFFLHIYCITCSCLE